MIKINQVTRFIRTLMLLLPFVCGISTRVQAQPFGSTLNYYDWVFYKYPFQSLVQGVKLGVERNASNRMIFGMQIQRIQTEFPNLYMVREDNDPVLNVILTPRLKSETMVQFHLKNYIGRYNYCFNGWYMGAFCQFGYGQGAFTSQLSKGARVYHSSNQYIVPLTQK